MRSEIGPMNRATTNTAHKKQAAIKRPRPVFVSSLAISLSAQSRAGWGKGSRAARVSCSTDTRRVVWADRYRQSRQVQSHPCRHVDRDDRGHDRDVVGSSGSRRRPSACRLPRSLRLQPSRRPGSSDGHRRDRSSSNHLGRSRDNRRSRKHHSSSRRTSGSERKARKRSCPLSCCRGNLSVLPIPSPHSGRKSRAS